MKFAVFGYPIGHSLSPFIHQSFAQQFGLPLTYEAIEAQPKEFKEKLTQFIQEGGIGANITSPLKEIAFALASETSNRCQLAKATNTLVFQPGSRLYADNTDGIGLIRDFDFHQIALSDKHLLILGYGGASLALVPFLKQQGAHITIASRNPSSINNPLVDVQSYENLTGTFDIIIHATPLGFKNQCPPIPSYLSLEKTICYDLSYGQAHRPFQQWAKQHHAQQIISGLGMLIEQAAESFTLWLGKKPQTTPIREDLLQKLAMTS